MPLTNGPVGRISFEADNQNVGFAFCLYGRPVGKNLANLVEAQRDDTVDPSGFVHGFLSQIVKVRGLDHDAGVTRRLYLWRKDSRVDPAEQIDKIELFVDAKVDSLDPLCRLRLILPLDNLDAGVFSGRDHGLRDVLGEGISARHRQRQDTLARGAGADVECRAGCAKGWQL